MWTVEPLVLSVEDMAGWRQVKRAVFARHCNPWSAWTRWASAPLVLVPVWRRSWRDAALVGVWMAVNPIVFGKPAHERAWATRAVLGEEQWIEDRPMDAAMAVNVGASVAGVAAMIAARKRRAAPAAVSMATLMALLLWYWELMARYHDEPDGELDDTKQPLKGDIPARTRGSQDSRELQDGHRYPQHASKERDQD